MTEVTILITCIGGGLSAQFANFLKNSKRHKIKVVGVDSSESPIARHFCDEFIQVPAGEDPFYPEKIFEICRAHSIDIAFPCADEEALALARVKNEFEKRNIVLACNKIEMLEIVCDKIATYKKLEELNIEMPLWREIIGQEAALESIDEFIRLKGEAVLKLPTARGGRGTIIINNDLDDIIAYDGSKELHMNLKTFQAEHLVDVPHATAVMVMERLLEPVHDLDVLAWEGQAIHLLPRKRIHSALPNEGHIIVENDAMVEIGQKIVEGFGASWLFDIDLMTTQEGKPAVLEINPRASGSVSVPIAAGIPLMDDLISLALGEQVNPVKPPFGKVIFPYSALATL